MGSILGITSVCLWLEQRRTALWGEKKQNTANKSLKIMVPFQLDFKPGVGVLYKKSDILEMVVTSLGPQSGF